MPAFVQARFDALAAPMAIAGLSEGGMCATMLTLRHPEIFTTFADFSGLTSPTVSEQVDPDLTTRELFDGSVDAYRAHDPLWLLAPPARHPRLAGWFEVGTADEDPLRAQHTLVPLARAAGLLVCRSEISGGTHGFSTWAQCLRDALPWLAFRLGIGPDPGFRPAGATCS